MSNKNFPSNNAQEIFDANRKQHQTKSTFDASRCGLEEQPSHFNINGTFNPLVTISAPLLMIVTYIREQTVAPNLNQLFEILQFEIKHFEKQAYQLNYPTTTILAARYFLCALIDETIFAMPWGIESLWQQKNLLNTFQGEQQDSARFLFILERHCHDPKEHLHLLELGYLCLSIGFEGKHDESEKLMTKLYHLIRSERGEFSNQLLVSAPTKSTVKKQSIRVPSVWFAISIAIIGLATSYIPYYLQLNKLTKPLILVVNAMSQNNE